MLVKNLCISLIYNKLNAHKQLICNQAMYKLFTIFAKFLNIGKQVSGNFVK